MNRVFVASAVAAAFVVAPAAMAQSDAPLEAAAVVAAAPAAEGPTTQRAAPERRAFRLPSERVEARLAYLRTALKINDAQQPQWENFASVLRRHARDMDQRIQQRRAQAGQQGGRDPRTVSAIERLERTQQRMAVRSAQLNEVIVAAKPLYAALSPEQKQVADEMLARHGGRGAHHRHRHGGMHRGV